MIKDLIQKNRSYRRFYEDVPVGHSTLRDLIDLARLSASSANLQPLKYVISFEPDKNALIFPHLRWAGYLADWPGPVENERPPAYIIILGDLSVTKTFGCDHGIAAQSILLGAVEKGLGGCIISNIDRPGLKKALNLTDGFEILLAIALGKPKEKVTVVPLGPEGDVRYWRDSAKTHHVPKRRLDDIILDPFEEEKK